jgi:hypothetical protein
VYTGVLEGYGRIRIYWRGDILAGRIYMGILYKYGRARPN